MSPPVATTVDLVELFRGHAAARPDAPAFAWFDGRCVERTRYDNAGFLARCEGLAGALRARGLAPGEPVLLLHPPGAEFFEAFFACLIAGIVPVPAYPPDPLGRGPRLDFITRICAHIGIRAALTTARYNTGRRLGNVRHALRRGGGWPDVRWIATDKLAPGPTPPAHRPAPDDVAFMQFTSGSTGDPRGVAITHRNLMHQLRVNAAQGGIDSDSRVLVWLPQYHDFGLVNGFLCALCAGCPVWMCSPLDFLADPAVWPEMMHRVRATHSASPDFGFAYAVRKTTPEQRRAWDLSSVRCIASGGEAVRPATVRAFCEAFAPSGFARESLYGGFGQAEHVVGMTGGPVVLETFDADRLRADGVLTRVAPDHPRARELASSGRAFEGVHLRIVDRERRVALPAGHIGEIWASSLSVAAGYVGDPEATAATFDNRLPGEGERRWLRTGDLGALVDGHLFVTGRLKELVIVRGRNVHPPDVEDRIRAAGIAALRPGGILATGVERGGEEHLAVIAELRGDRADAAELDAIAAAIRAAVAADGLPLGRLVLVPKGAVPKTTSGKLRRRRCAALLAEGRPIGDRPPLLDATWDAPPATPDADAALAEALAALDGPVEARAAAARAALIDWLAAQMPDGIALPEPAADGRLTGVALAELGLDSLRIAALVDAVERGLGAAPSRAEAFELSTVEQWVDWLADPPPPEAPAPTAAPPTGPVPATPFQRVIRRDHGAAPGAVMVYAIEGGLTADHARRALAALMARHDLLRVRLVEGDGPPMLAPQPAPDPADAPLIEVAPEALEDALRRPFALDRAPPVRLVFAAADDGVRLGLALHHLAYDGVSIHALLAELVEALGRAAAGEAPAVEPAPSFLALAAARADAPAGDVEWWRRALSEAPWPPPVPRDVPVEAPKLVPAGGFELGPDALDALERHARAHGVTPNAVVAAAWAGAMGAALGVPAIVCAHPVSLRGPKTRAVSGPLVDDVLLPLPADPALALDARAARVDAQLRRAARNADVSLEAQLELLPGAPTACPVLYAFYDWDRMAPQPAARALRAGRPWTAGPLTLRPLPVAPATGPRPFDYFAAAEREGGRLRCSLRVSHDRVGAAFGAAIVDGWRRALAALTEGVPG